MCISQIRLYLLPYREVIRIKILRPIFVNIVSLVNFENNHRWKSDR